MFGYVTTMEPELKVKDYQTYRSFYCGLCSKLHTKYGWKGRITLNYDLTFLSILLTALYEEKNIESKKRCFLHPTRKTKRFSNQYIDYASDMTILLTYYQCLDHWADDRNPLYCIEAGIIRNSVKDIATKYPRQFHAVFTYIKKQEEAEHRQEKDLDYIAGITGNMLKELFVYKEDEWSEYLRNMGFYLGKFIYLMDAYEDLEKDKASGSYNPLLEKSTSENFSKYCNLILNAMMAECAKNFEILPILEYVDILRNILYAGVWKKYELVQKKRGKEIKQDESL